MKYRHEWKHEISLTDMYSLRSRLSAVMKLDDHTVNGTYQIRSLYFDNPEDKALREKIDGVNYREKFRIRYYNGDTTHMLLEKKSKVSGLCLKEQQEVSCQTVEQIIAGDYIHMEAEPGTLLYELLDKMRTQGMMPKTIVDYTREPFVYTAGNVRVTLDYDLRVGSHCLHFLNSDCITVPIIEAPIILEVKWDEYLPDFIRRIVQIPTSHEEAFSKYALCRMYG